MKVFLTYASEQKSIAQTIAFSLRGRGFDVFLDKDDLPPGKTYDQQIEAGIGASDYLVFLVSPESVQTGRYTRTELEFARRKWRNPDGRILPVMAAPTDIKSIPEFLRAVTILEPQGNIAAEVGAMVAASERQDASSLLAWMSGAAVISALLTAYWSDLPGANALHFIFSGGPSLYSGVYFGLALAIPLFLRLQIPIPQLAVLLVIVQIAWQLAVIGGLAVGNQVEIKQSHVGAALESSGGDGASGSHRVTSSSDASRIKPALIVPGLIGGLIGSFGTWLAGAAASARLRHLEAGLLTTVVGTAAGLVLALDSFVILFLLWQTAVAASVAHGIARSG